MLKELTELSVRGNEIQEQNVNYALALSMENESGTLVEIDKESICHTIMGKQMCIRDSRWSDKRSAVSF